MRPTSTSSLAFFFFQLLTATLFLRPAELVSWLEGVRINEMLIVAALGLSFSSVLSSYSSRTMKWQPITCCIVGLLFAVVLSHITHFYFGGAFESADQFLRVMVYYGLTLACVKSPSRLRAFLLNIAGCVSVVVTLCLLDYWAVIDMQHIVQLTDLEGFDDEGQPIFFMRLRGTGIFQDPNDLAMLIVAGGVLCLYFLTDKSLGGIRWAWGLPILIFAAAILETKSRGGLLAGVAAFMTLATFRFGTRFGVVMALAALVALPLVAGRSANIDLSDGSTGHERIEMWREGFDALKSKDFLFGIGHNTYPDLAGLVAHNSFVHAYVELGVFGGTLFFGCFFFAFLQLYRIGKLNNPVWHPELHRLRPYITAVLVGWCTSMLSLSRCYIVPTYMILGMVTAYVNLCWIHTPLPRPLVVWQNSQILKLSTASAVMFASLYTFTMMFS